MRYRANLTVPITLRRDEPPALHQQIADQLGRAVDLGLLVHDCRLPSTRTLAAVLGVSRGVSAAAYDLLEAGGYLRRLAGSGTYVAGTTGARHRVAAVRPALGGDRVPTAQAAVGPVPADEPVVDLRPGPPTPGTFPLAAWRAAWRRASFRRPPATLPPLGLPELREAVAGHLLRTRGLPVDPAHVVITGGRGPGLRLVLDALGMRGHDVAMAEPAPAAWHRAVAGAVPPIDLPVDDAGARLDLLPGWCRAVVLGPDAQPPAGQTLSDDRRRDAAAWACATGGYLIEMACDTAFRPSASRLPRLSALAPEWTVLVGGFCEVLTPALRVGYALPPPGLVDALGERCEPPSYVAQLALAALLTDGTVLGTMHRLTRLYAERRRLVETWLGRARWLICGDPLDTAVLRLPAWLDAEQVAAGLLDAGVRVDSLAEHHFSSRPTLPGLVIGYGHPPEADLRRACLVVRDALAPLVAQDRAVASLLNSSSPAGPTTITVRSGSSSTSARSPGRAW